MNMFQSVVQFQNLQQSAPFQLLADLTPSSGAGGAIYMKIADASYVQVNAAVGTGPIFVTNAAPSLAVVAVDAEVVLR